MEGSDFWGIRSSLEAHDIIAYSLYHYLHQLDSSWVIRRDPKKVQQKLASVKDDFKVC